MTVLPLTKIAETATSITLGWVPLVGQEGYVPLIDGQDKMTDGKRHPSTSQTAKQVQIGKPKTGTHTYGVRILGTTAEGTYSPTPPPPSGTVRDAKDGEVLAAIAASKDEDTVLAVGGAHRLLRLEKSFSGPGPFIRTDPSSYFKGIVTNSKSGYDFNGISSILPVEPNNYDITPFYLQGTSERIRLTGAFKLSGGYDAIKVYGGSKDCVIDDGGAASMLSGYGGDGIHINQSTNLRVVSIGIGAPWQLGQTPEHNDGIHAQDFNNLYLGPGVRIEALGPRADVDSGGMFIRGEPGASGLIIDGVTIHWQIGRAFQLIDIDGKVEIKKISIHDSGIPGDSPAITFGVKETERVDVYEMIGFDKDDCYWNYGENRTFFH